MIRFEEIIEGRCSPQQAFGYLAEFANIQAWDPTVLSARALTPGPARVGSRFRLLLHSGLRPVRMHYTLVEMQPLGRLVFDGRGDTFRALDRITIVPTARGCRLSYTVAVDFDDPAGRRLGALAAPLLRYNIRRAGKRLQTILGGDGPLPRLSRGTRLADRLVFPGLIGFTCFGYRSGNKRWPLPPRPLEGRRVVLTGGTSGIGRAAADQLLACGAHLIIVGRHPEKTAAVCRQLSNRWGAEAVDHEIADLSLMSDIRALAPRLQDRYPAIHILVNNAGALFNAREETAEGFEKTLAINLLGPYLLTRSVLPLLRQEPDARIINVSSGGMYTQKIRPEDLQHRQSAYDGTTAYARAKRGLVILTELWAAELAPHAISVQAMHPGWVDTPGLQASLPTFYRYLRPLLRTPAQGADTITWLAASPVAGRTSGLFWLDRKPRTVHVLPGTRETPAERRALLAALDRMAGD